MNTSFNISWHIQGTEQQEETRKLIFFRAGEREMVSNAMWRLGLGQETGKAHTWKHH